MTLDVEVFNIVSQRAKIVMGSGVVSLLFGILLLITWILDLVSAQRECDENCQIAESMGGTCQCEWNYGELVGWPTPARE